MHINRFYYLLNIYHELKVAFLKVKISRNLSLKNMATNEELEKRIEALEKEVQHLKAFLQYQMRNKKK